MKTKLQNPHIYFTPSQRGRLLAFFLLFIMACRPGDPTVGDGSETGDNPNIPPDAKNDPYSEEIEEASTAIAGVHLVGYGDARARCLQKKTGKDNYQVVCHTVSLGKNGEEILATGLGKDVRQLTWKNPSLTSGEATLLRCYESSLGLKQTCDLKVHTEVAALDFTLEVTSITEQQRQEKAAVLLPFSIEYSAGLVPFMPSVFQMKSANKENQPNKVGFTKRILEHDAMDLRVSSMCQMGDTLYFAHGVTIFTLDKKRKISAYAGSVNPANFSQTDSKDSIYLGHTLSLACYDQSLYILSENPPENHGRTFVRLVQINTHSGKTTVRAGGTFDLNSPQTNIPTAFGVNPLGANMQGTRGMHVVHHDMIYFSGRRTETKLMFLENNRLKRRTLPSTDELGEGYHEFSDVTIFQNKLLLAAPSDHMIYELAGLPESTILRRYLGDGSIAPTQDGVEAANFTTTPLAGPQFLTQDGENLYIATKWGSIRTVNQEGRLITLFANDQAPYDSDFEYVQTENPLTSRGYVSSFTAYAGQVILAGNGYLRSISGESIQVLAGRPSTLQQNPQNLTGMAAQLVIPEARSIATSPDGGFYMLDARGGAIYQINSQGIMQHIAGDRLSSNKSGPNPKAVLIPDAVAIALHDNGDIYYALRHEIYRIVKDGGVVHVAGSATDNAPTVDGIDAKAAKIGSISSMALWNGEIYFTEEVVNATLSVGHRIMKVSSEGLIHRVAGQSNGSSGDNASDVQALQASLNTPTSITMDAQGKIYFIDSGNKKIRQITSGLMSTRHENFHGTSLTIAASGQLFAIAPLEGESGLPRLLSFKEDNNQLISATLFGGSASRQCGSGAIKGHQDPGSELYGLQGSLALLCSGDRLTSIVSSPQCTGAGEKRSFSLILAQNFSYGPVQGYGNIIKINLPCPSL